MDEGWIKVYWKTLDSLAGSSAMTLGVWTRILLSVARKRQVLRNGDVLEPGEAILSTKDLAKWADVSDRTIRRYIEVFERDGMIAVTKRDRKGTRVSVVNWATYQDSKPPGVRKAQRKRNASATKVQRNGAQTESPKSPKSPEDVDAAFDAWYAAYPRKVARDDARKAYEKALDRIRGRAGPGGEDPAAILLERATAFAASPKAKTAFVPYPATWLNKGRYDDDPAEWQRGDDDSRIGAGQKYDPQAEIQWG